MLSRNDGMFLYGLFADAVKGRGRGGMLSLSDVFRAWRHNTRQTHKTDAKMELSMFVGFVLGANCVNGMITGDDAPDDVTGESDPADFVDAFKRMAVNIDSQVLKRTSVLYRNDVDS